MQALAQLHALVADKVRQNEGGASALTLDRVDEDLAAAVEGLVDETICDAEVLFGVFLRFVVQLQVEVLEVAVALGVRLAGDVEDVGHAGLDQLTSLEGTLEGTHVDAPVHLEETDVPDRLLTVDIASTEVDMGESTTSHLLLISRVRLAVIILAHAGFLLVDGSTTEPGIALHLLELGDADSARLLALTLDARLLTLILIVHLLLNDPCIVLVLHSLAALILSHAIVCYLVLIHFYVYQFFCLKYTTAMFATVFA